MIPYRVLIISYCDGVINWDITMSHYLYRIYFSRSNTVQGHVHYPTVMINLWLLCYIEQGSPFCKKCDGDVLSYCIYCGGSNLEL